MLISPNEVQRETSKPARKFDFDLPIQVLDLSAQFKRIGDEVQAAVREVFDQHSYILGPKVAEFERAFAAHAGAKHCVAVNSGTSALHLALICAGVRAGDEVITVPMTFIATSWAISYCGATPVFVDVDPRTCTMDPSKVEAKISGKTKAILPVHLYGQPVDLEPLREIAARRGIALIEDCAQSHGAKYHGIGVGTIGMCGCFSFYPGKNLGACGEAGAIITSDDTIAKRLRALRDHAQQQRYQHEEIGFNYRMDGIQGAVLGVKMNHIDRWTDSRRTLAQRYVEELANLPVQLPSEAIGRRHVWHLFVARHPQRDAIRAKLLERGIQTALHYPIPVHLQNAYKHLGHRAGDFPVSEQIASECFTLPLYPEMGFDRQDVVIDAMREVLS